MWLLTHPGEAEAARIESLLLLEDERLRPERSSWLPAFWSSVGSLKGLVAIKREADGGSDDLVRNELLGREGPWKLLGFFEQLFLRSS